MKVLMIGMDGAHYNAFQRGWTPFIKTLLDKQTAFPIKNDLHSRGWLEIATGHHARRTSAMYDKPRCQASREWSLDFKFSDAERCDPSAVPLWHAINRLGYKVGVMNLPTTFPAPEVDGFFVSGGGGGAPVTEAATESLCFPAEVAGVLNDNGYIVDQRLYQLVVDKELKKPEQIFQQLAHKNQMRTKGFLELDKIYNVDFGFIVYKTASVFAETFYTTEKGRERNPKNKIDRETLTAIEEYYRSFDNEIRKLREAYPDAELIFVSDHGTEPREFTINPNVLLGQHGLYAKSRADSFLKRGVIFAKKIIPFNIKALLKKRISKSKQSIGAFDFDSKNTKAFCKTFGDWRHGIYVNDVDRFGGCVNSSEKQVIVTKIIELINTNATSIQHGICAKATKEIDEKCGKWYPDVVLEVPDGYLTSDLSKEYLSAFCPPVSRSALQSIMKGDILSLKSHWPLFSTTLSCSLESPEQKDLTIVYDVVLDHFRSITRD